jgi:fructose-1,6-bisphosphatase/inositol monophosphatase family enzyme
VIGAGIDRRAAGHVAGLLAAAAQADILPRFRRLEAQAVRAKSGPLDLVTDADEAAERRIAAALAEAFPGCAVVGEEAATADPRILDRLADADLAFVVDPIDGTANFVAGVPVFGCMTAAVRRGEVVASWIHDPIGGETAIALRGEGAWIERPDGACRDLRVAPPAAVGAMVGAVSWGFMAEPLRSRVTARLPSLAAVVGYRCAAQEYRLAAAGHLHVLVYHRLLPWDHAPGWLLHRESGGHAAQFDGRPYSPLVRTGGLICAPDAASWGAVRDALGLAPAGP